MPNWAGDRADMYTIVNGYANRGLHNTGEAVTASFRSTASAGDPTLPYGQADWFDEDELQFVLQLVAMLFGLLVEAAVVILRGSRPMPSRARTTTSN
jgi:hypothetical protein